VSGQVVASSGVRCVVAQFNSRLQVVIVAINAAQRQVVTCLLVAGDGVLHIAHALEVVAPPAEQLFVADLFRVLLQVDKLVAVEKHARHLNLMRVGLLVELDGHGQVVALLAELGIVVAGVAQVDSVVAVGDVESLGPLVHVLIELVEEVVTLGADEKFLGLVDHAQIQRDDGHLGIGVGASGCLFAQEFYALDVAHIAQADFGHVDSMGLDAHLGHIFPYRLSVFIF